MGPELVGLSCMHRIGSAQIGGKELCSLEFLQGTGVEGIESFALDRISANR